MRFEARPLTPQTWADPETLFGLPGFDRARLLEAYQVGKPQRNHDDFMFFGSRSLYERAGFHEVARRSPPRIVMRRALMSRERTRNRTPSGASSGNPEPRPGTTSTVR